MFRNDADVEKLIRESVWHGIVQTPKTQSAFRIVAVSEELAALLQEQVERQRVKGHEFLFSASTGSPIDMNLVRRKLKPLLKLIGIADGEAPCVSSL